MKTIYIYRVYQHKHGTVCIWAGSIAPYTQTDTLMKTLLEEHVIIPKEASAWVARYVPTMSDELKRMLEAYPHSTHHSPKKELGIGLALDQEKWEKKWPQYRWSKLQKVGLPLGGFKVVSTETEQWTVKQLQIQRKKRTGRPQGCPNDLWDSLSFMRTDLGPNRPKRRKNGRRAKRSK